MVQETQTITKEFFLWGNFSDVCQDKNCCVQQIARTVLKISSEKLSVMGEDMGQESLNLVKIHDSECDCVIVMHVFAQHRGVKN